MRLVKICALAFLMQGCVSLQSVSLTQIPKNRNQTISASSSRWIIFGFNFDNNYVDAVSRKLMDKCQGKQIKGILTKDELTNYFLHIVVKRSVHAQGFCV